MYRLQQEEIKLKNLFLDYARWTSVRKAKDWLKNNNIEVEIRPIVSNTPTKEELLSWIQKYNVDVKKFFNSNGKIYKENNLKDKIDDFSIDECCDMLSKEPMLIKRPIFMNDEVILFGFKQKEWEENLLKK